MLLRSLLVLLACLFLVFAVTPAQAQQVQLTWDAPLQTNGTPVPNLAGYKLYYGSQSGQYPTMIPVGMKTTYTVTNLSAGRTYYFAAKAYDSTGTESAFSNEVRVTAPSAQLSATPTTLTAGGTVTAAWSGIATPRATDWIGLYSAGAANTTFINWIYVSCSMTSSTARASGSCPFTVPATLTPGNYELRLLANNGFTSLATRPIVIARPSAQVSASLTRGQAPLTGTDRGGAATKAASTTRPTMTTPTPPPVANFSATTTDTTGLVAAYSFDEGNGITVTDVSGQDNHGTITEATWTTQGKFGAALAFNGTTSWVTVPDAPSLDLATGMTLEAWVYPIVTLTGWRTVIQKEEPDGPDGVVYFLEANSDVNQPATGVSINGEEILYGLTRLVAGTWTHLAATYDGTWQRLYVNGVEVAQRAQPGLIASSSGVLRIGGDSVWGQYFQGRIDEVRIYNRALSTSEIQADMDTPINLLNSLPPLSVGGAVQEN